MNNSQLSDVAKVKNNQQEKFIGSSLQLKKNWEEIDTFGKKFKLAPLYKQPIFFACL